MDGLLGVFGVLTLLLLATSLWAQDDDARRREAESRVDSLISEVNALVEDGEYAKARQVAEQALATAERELGPNHASTATCLNNLAFILESLGDLTGARPLYERSLAIREATLGGEHLETATSLNNLGSLLFTLGEPRAAKALLERALAIRERALGPDDPDTAVVVNNLAGVLWSMGDPRGAVPLLERALAISEKVDGPENPGTVTILVNLAIVLGDLGEFSRAMSLNLRALAIQEKVCGPEHLETAAALLGLASTCRAMGDFDNAMPPCVRALGIHEKLLGPDHPVTVTNLSELAGLLQSKGDLNGAKTQFERVLAIDEKVFGPDHQNTACALENLAHLLMQVGDLKGARPLFERALAISERSLGAEHVGVASGLCSLGGLLMRMGDVQAAKAAYERAVAIDEKALGPESLETALALGELAWALAGTGDTHGAKACQERAVAVLEKVLGPDHPTVGAMLIKLGYRCEQSGDPAAAKPLYERALAISEKVYGPEHTETARCLNQVARIRHVLGDIEGAKPLYERAWKVNRAQILSLFPILSEEQRRSLLASRALDFGYYLASFFDDPIRTYSAAVTWKGAALRASVAAERLPEGASREVREMAERLGDRRRQLAGILLGPKRPREGEPSHQEQVEAAEREMHELEIDLARQAPDFAKRAFFDATVADVQGTLPTGAALLDLVDVDPSIEARLHVWVLRPEEDPGYWYLPGAAEVESWSRQFRDALQSDDRKGWADAGWALRKRMRYVFDRLRDIDTLYVSANGALATIPWGLLPDGERGAEHFLLERVRVVYVSCGAGLAMAARTERNESVQGLLAVGGVDYDAAEGGSDKAPGASRQVPSLPATSQEAKGVAERFAARFPKAPVTLLEGKKATEGAVKRGAPKARFLHVATHGCFDIEDLRVALAGVSRGPAGMMQKEVPDIEPSRPGETSRGGWNPLLLSWIALAGSNVGDGGGDEDGLLTAEELQGLDLRGTELVVLSACETGRGELAAGEGVLGLSRALSIAGARSFMLSLWRVPDAETSELMDLFYAGLWGEKGLPPEEALRQAQLAMLARDREHNAFRPSTWGAWTLNR